MAKEIPIRIPSPEAQIDFSFALTQARNLMLQDALGKTVESLSITSIDQQLALFAPAEALSALARKGLRGELLFCVPCVLEQNPRLLGYYRLLLGFSQKAFYVSELGLTRFKNMEEKGLLTEENKGLLESLCQELNRATHKLLTGMGPERISRDLLDDLTLLTLGPQLRGGSNVKLGVAGIAAVFEVIHRIVAPYAQSASAHGIEILNAAGRKVLIEFAADPDIVIREEMAPQNFRNIIAVREGIRGFSQSYDQPDRHSQPAIMMF